MAIYIVGDIQGCALPLRRLLDSVRFDPSEDELWSVGDLINRGPDNLGVLRFVRSLGSRFRGVLGNHDLNFLAVHHGLRQPKPADTLSDLLAASDREELVTWLRGLPLAFYEQQTLVVHAGVPPRWTLEQTLQRAAEVHHTLLSDDYCEFLRNMYGNTPLAFSEELRGWARLRTIVNALTRMRFCSPEGYLDFANKAGPERPPVGMLPWYAHPNRSLEKTTIAFGHWATLDGQLCERYLVALDTGCVWGRRLTCLRLEDRSFHHCDCS